ncbi:hypothetical protein [Pseudonocardia sp.]|uniref:hypothetical protein n=1 Tax=Pseudonocardia sp. TaxID=60912 RepID=UPI0031FDBD24
MRAAARPDVSAVVERTAVSVHRRVVSEDAEPGEYLTCRLSGGHRGRRQLAVANTYD